MPKPKPKPKAASGLTAEEQLVADALVSAWNAFVAIDGAITQDDAEDFRQAIHAAQRVLQGRIVQRAYPEYWR